MAKIVQTEDRSEGHLHIRYIFGLGIFATNKLPHRPDLNVEFLKFLSTASLVSAHAVIPSDLSPSPLELFGPPEQAEYQLVSVGPKPGSGSFYRVQDWPRFPGCFFPKVTNAFWGVIKSSTDVTWGKILYYDAVVFYISPITVDYLSRMAKLFATGAEARERWIEEILDIYRIVVISAGDMNYFKAFARKTVDFNILSDSIQYVEEIVTADPWYQDNKDNLERDGKNCMCLRLKT